MGVYMIGTLLLSLAAHKPMTLLGREPPLLPAPGWHAAGDAQDSSTVDYRATPPGTAPKRLDVNGVDYDTNAIVDNDHFRTDSKVQIFTVRPGSHGCPCDVANGNERSELVTSDVLAGKKIYQFGEDIWLSYSFMVALGEPITAPWGIVGQFHDWHDPEDRKGLSPPLSFVINPTQTNNVELGLWTRFDPERATLAQKRPINLWKANFQRGQWIRIVLHVRPDFEGKALAQLWVNGDQVLDRSDFSTGYNNPSGFGYWQYGLYRKANKNTTEVRYANMEQSKSSLLGRVSNPLPLP